MSRSNCPVRVYNKDISKKYRADFFILADAKYYFIYNIGVCQGNNTENIDIHPSLQNLPTTHKYVSKDIIKRGVWGATWRQTNAERERKEKSGDSRRRRERQRRRGRSTPTGIGCNR